MTRSPAHQPVTHPGPPDPVRIASQAGRLRCHAFTLQPGLSLLAAVDQAMREAGLTGAGIRLDGARFGRFEYVIPALSSTPEHVAYYSETFRPAGEITLMAGTATFGSRDGAGFLHCHAMWREPGLGLRGGHLLPPDCIIAAPSPATAWGTADAAMRSVPDAETGFTLFRPEQGSPPADGDCILACLRPGEDLVTAIEAVCARHAITRATIRSGVGSLVGVEFEDGSRVDDIPTEFFVTHGVVGETVPGRLDVSIAIADMRGTLHQGRPARGRNPVLICCELTISAEKRAGP